MLTTLSFINHYLLVTVTSSIPAGGDFLPYLKEDMNLLIKNKLLHIGRDGALVGGRQVLWEKEIKGKKSSILDILIPASDLTTKDILGIRYIKKRSSTLTGSIFITETVDWSRVEAQWCLFRSCEEVKAAAGVGNDETGIDLEEMDEDLIIDIDTSWSQQSFNAGQKRSNHPVKVSEEKSWEHLLWSIYYTMHNIINKANEESSQSDSLNLLPFNVVLELRYWFSEFTTTSVPDATNSYKPDLVLMDFRLKKNESGKKTWADVLTNIKIIKSELVQGKGILIF